MVLALREVGNRNKPKLGKLRMHNAVISGFQTLKCIGITSCPHAAFAKINLE